MSTYYIIRVMYLDRKAKNVLYFVMEGVDYHGVVKLNLHLETNSYHSDFIFTMVLVLPTEVKVVYVTRVLDHHF